MAPVEVTQVGLMWRLARQKYGLPDLDPLVAQAAPAAPAGAPPAAPADEKKHKVKVNQVLDQVDEGEIPRLQEAELDAFYERLREVKGGPVRPEAEPSPDQISAMKVRVLDLEMAPYADFGLFVNHQQRFARTLKFMSHQLQPDGTWRSVEIHGPPNFDTWLASWRVYENVLLMLTKPVGGSLQPIITQAALDDYRESFRDLVVNYPESWHLLVTAEDRCRGEHFARLRRRLQEEFDTGLAPGYNPANPWQMVFRRAAADREYWDRHVREPALLYRTSGHRAKESRGGTGTATDRTGEPKGEEEAKSPKKRKRKSQKERLRAKLRQANEEKEKAPAAGPDKGSKRDRQGRFLVDRNNKPICFAYNNGNCKGVCPKNMTHCCQLCLGSHPAKECKKPPQNWGGVPAEVRPAPQPREVLDGPGETRTQGADDCGNRTAPRRTLFLELLAGTSSLTRCVQRRLASQGEILDPEDCKWGVDLTHDDRYAEILEGIRTLDLWWVHLAPLCPVGNEGERGRDQPLRALAHPGGLGDAATETGDLLADRAVAVGEMQVARGRYVSIENPWESWIWELK